MKLILQYNLSRRVRIQCLTLFAILLCLPNCFRAQVADSTNQINSKKVGPLKNPTIIHNPIPHKHSTVQLNPGEISNINLSDSTKNNIQQPKLSNKNTLKIHNPNTALILSAIIPGAGQVYNRQAWKIPIVYAGLGGVGYFIYSNYNDMQLYKKEYLYRVNHDNGFQNPDLIDYPTTNIYNLYESYNKNFQLFCLVEVAVYGLNLLDAYVFGHLFDFERENNMYLTLNPMLIPNNFNYSPGLCLQLKF